MLFYYLDASERQHGPFTPEQFGELWRQGSVTPNTLARTDRMQQWVPVTSLPDHVPGFIVAGIDGGPEPKKLQHWGYRYAVRLMKNPLEILLWFFVASLIVAAYRWLELEWIFPPNKAPAPAIDLSPDGFGSARPTPLLYRPDGDGAEFTLVKQSVSPGSLAGLVRRALSGPQHCIKPDYMVSLPPDLPRGRFYLKDHNNEIFFSADDPDAQLAGRFTPHKTAYTLSAVKIASATNEFRPELGLPRITSYSQASDLFTEIVGSVEGALIEGGQAEWGTFNREATERGPYQDSTYATVNRVEEKRHGDAPTIAVAFGSQNRTIAISDLYPPEDLLEGRSRLSRLRLLVGGKQARAISKDYTRGVKEAAGLPLHERRKKIAEASPYFQLVFSRDGRYLAGLLADGRVRIYNSTLREMATLDVDTLGPYIASGARAGVRALAFSSPRVTFHDDSSILVGCDAGNLFHYDLRTNTLNTVGLPGRVDACTVHRPSGNVVAASAETGEVYIVLRKELASGRLALESKALLAGLGPMVGAINFSRDGDSLSAIFNDREYGSPKGEFREAPPVSLALFWSLAGLRTPPNELPNNFRWYCQDRYAASYPGHEGAFVSIARRTKENRLVVLTHDRATSETKQFPLRALSSESQRYAIMMHSLVEFKDSPYYFNPRKKVSHAFPAAGRVPLPGGDGVAQRPTASSRKPTVVWRRLIVGGHPHDASTDVAVDSGGNAIVSGDIGSQAGHVKGYVWKYSPTGNRLWEFELDDAYPKAGHNRVYAVEVAEDASIYYVGCVDHEELDSTNLCYGRLSPEGRLVGEYRHEKRSDGRGMLFDIVPMKQGGYAVGGYVYHGFRKHRETTNTFVGILNEELRLRPWKDDDSGRNSKTGTPRRHGTKKIINGLAPMSDGGLAVAGRDMSTGDFHAYIQRRTPKLGVKWSQRLPYRGESINLLPTVAVGSDDSIYIGHADRGRSDRTQQFCLMKYSPDGQLVWQRKLKSQSRDIARRMTTAPDGSLVVAGKCDGQAALVRVSPSGTVSRPFRLFPSKQSSGGEAFAVEFSPDGYLYAVGRAEAEDGGSKPYNTDPTGGPWGHYGGKNSAFLVKVAWGELLDAPEKP